MAERMAALQASSGVAAEPVKARPSPRVSETKPPPVAAPQPTTKTQTLESAWTFELSGGSLQHPTWPLNPQWQIFPAVESGTRCVYVASFSAQGGREMRVTAAAASRDIYGDLV